MARYPRKDGGTVDTTYRGQDVHVAGDGTIFAKPKAPPPARAAKRSASPRLTGAIRRPRKK
jgi:hypothetical protein